MYKLLLCVRYLRTRYIALASIISVMLGVATMIVVNSVMAGFTNEMRDRIHGYLADIVIECRSKDGIADSKFQLQKVHDTVGEYVEAATATVDMPGVITLEINGERYPTPVTIVGIVPQEKAKVGPLVDCLASYQPTVENGKTVPPLRSRDIPPGWELTDEAAKWRQFTMGHLEDRLRREGLLAPSVSPELLSPGSVDTKTETPEPPIFDDLQSAQTGEASFSADPDPFKNNNEFEQGINKEPRAARVYLGEELISAHYPNQETGKLQKVMLVRPGEDVTITTVKSGQPEPVSFQATICDVFRSGMTEYDSKLVLVNLEQLQQNRGMLTRDENGEIAVDHITSIQIKLKDYEHAEVVVDKLKAAFDPADVTVRTWESTQVVLLSAVEMETAILNVLLFLIITVAGFGILAIFYMIVVEKTRDIGILKSLGASSRGVMSIFLSYGLALGLVGSAAGVTIGLVFVKYINEIEDALSWATGREVFNRDIYYFNSIPTHVNPMMVFWVALGAMGIAVLASILPARRASRLHPVRALRFD